MSQQELNLLTLSTRQVAKSGAGTPEVVRSQLLDAHPGRLAELARDFGFREHDVVTLASMIEKEARAPEERALIASVFFNRLRDC